LGGRKDIWPIKTRSVNPIASVPEQVDRKGGCEEPADPG